MINPKFSNSLFRCDTLMMESSSNTLGHPDSKSCKEEDFISKLPDEILTHVLSYNTTKFAVATSVLSKRWNSLWKSVPNLDFGEAGIGDNSFIAKTIFANFVERVLKHNNALSVRKVHLNMHMHAGFDISHITDLFKSIVMRDAEMFYLSLNFRFMDTLFSSPRGYPSASFFHQKRLVKLVLRNVPLKVPPSVCFPCLKEIYFACLRFCNKEAMTNLLSGCPVLTDFTIIWCKRDATEKLFVCSSTLRNLTIGTIRNSYGNVEILIDTPKLKSLSLFDKAAVRYETTGLPLLKHAHVRHHSYTACLFELLTKISHVKELFMEHTATASIRNGRLDRVPMFHKLTHLTVEIGYTSELAVVCPLVLSYTPDGVNISFNIIKDEPRFFSWYKSSNLPQSIISCIETVQLSKKDDCERRLVMTFILKTATGWKKMIFPDFPIHCIRKDRFLKTFLPISNESKINKAFVPIH